MLAMNLGPSNPQLNSNVPPLISEKGGKIWRSMKAEDKKVFLLFASLSCMGERCTNKLLDRIYRNPNNKSVLLCNSCYQKVIREGVKQKLVRTRVYCSLCEKRILKMPYREKTDKSKMNCNRCYKILWQQQKNAKNELEPSLKQRGIKRQAPLPIEVESKADEPIAKVQKVAKKNDVIEQSQKRQKKIVNPDSKKVKKTNPSSLEKTLLPALKEDEILELMGSGIE
jgi:hypothetical protein